MLAIFGADFEVADTALVILAVGQLVALASGPVGAVLVMTGRERLQRDAAAAAVAVNLVGNLVLVPTYGMVGAASATAVALIVALGPVRPSELRRVLDAVRVRASMWLAS